MISLWFRPRSLLRFEAEVQEAAKLRLVYEACRLEPGVEDVYRPQEQMEAYKSSK